MRLITKISILVLLSVNLFSFSFFSYFSPNTSSENLLAISWQENFCKLNSYKRVSSATQKCTKVQRKNVPPCTVLFS